MKNFFRLLVVAVAATALFSGCQKYDDSQIRQEIKDLGDRIAALEAWTRNSQEAVDYVAVLKEAVKNMNSIESVDVFEDEYGSGYVITFTNKQTIRLYNGNDGDTFFGNINVGTSCVEFILADGTSFFVDRVTSSISFDSFETKAVTKGSTVWTVMDKNFKKEDFAAFTAELKTDDGTATSIATKSAADGNPWKIEAIAPEFGEDGKLVKPAGVIFKETPQAGGKGVLKVSLVTNNGKETSSSLVVDIVPNYLAFEAVEAGATVSMEIVGQCDAPSLKYSTDLTEWTDFDFSNPQTITLESVGDKVYWRNAGKTDHFSKDNENFVHFVLGDKKVAAEGNVMSLVDSSCESLTIPCDWCFIKLFKASSLEKGPELPATTLTSHCYMSMFAECKSLKEIPVLSAVEMADSCYLQMFIYCTSLEKAPVLPATKLAEGCYYSMFRNCDLLKEAPALPAKELARNCYRCMFMYCSSLEVAPKLPATTLSICCYSGMFAYCESLKEAPALPATELPRSCYDCMFVSCSSLTEAPDIPATKVEYGSCFSMFDGCTSLRKAPALPAKQLDEFCYQQMFANCTSLEEAPELPATELSKACYSMMFTSCTSLKEAPVLPALKMAEQCYLAMFQACESLETAPELPATELALACYSDMFLLCSSLKNAPALPATQLEPYCYNEMFIACESLVEAPELPATELAEGCYCSMFQECSSLENAPELPAELLYNACYADMFALCTSLTKAPELPAKELFYGCYYEMFYGCTSLKEAPELPATDLVEECYSGMFNGCSSLNGIKVAFTDWGEEFSATADWVAGVGAEGSFECPEGLEVKYGDDFIPTGWSVNGVAPATTRSFAAPATKSVSRGLRKAFAPKTLEIQNRLVGTIYRPSAVSPRISCHRLRLSGQGT